MKAIKTRVLIIGGGAAGLNAALNLKVKEAILIEDDSSNSAMSLWNLMIADRETLKKKILDAGRGMSDANLVETFLKDYRGALQDLKMMGIKLRKSNFGFIPDYSFPIGPKVKNIFLEKIKNNNRKTKILKGKVINFLTDDAEKIIGVSVVFSKSKKARIFFDYLIVAAGGLGGIFPLTTGNKGGDGGALSLCYEAGLMMRNLEFFMFHPFFIAEKKLPRFLIAGDFLTKMDFHNEKGENFLSENVSYALRNNKHHYIFPEMNREFYAQTLRGEVFGKPFCSASWFEKFKKENEFGFIFKNLKKSDIEKIKFRPAFHFMIGGLVINENAQTNQENVYAAGEITNSIHGANRVGGLAVLESLVFGKRAAISINKRIKKEPESSISGKITERGKLGFSRKMKDKMMDALGPIIKEKELEEFYNLLKKKKNLTSQEKLVKKIAEISLLRKESVGAFYREGLPEAKTAPSSFLVKDSIFFK